MKKILLIDALKEYYDLKNEAEITIFLEEVSKFINTTMQISATTLKKYSQAEFEDRASKIAKIMSDIIEDVILEKDVSMKSVLDAIATHIYSLRNDELNICKKSCCQKCQKTHQSLQDEEYIEYDSEEFESFLDFLEDFVETDVKMSKNVLKIAKNDENFEQKFTENAQKTQKVLDFQSRMSKNDKNQDDEIVAYDFMAKFTKLTIKQREIVQKLVNDAQKSSLITSNREIQVNYSCEHGLNRGNSIFCALTEKHGGVTPCESIQNCPFKMNGIMKSRRK